MAKNSKTTDGSTVDGVTVLVLQSDKHSGEYPTSVQNALQEALAEYLFVTGAAEKLKFWEGKLAQRKKGKEAFSGVRYQNHAAAAVTLKVHPEGLDSRHCYLVVFSVQRCCLERVVALMQAYDRGDVSLDQQIRLARNEHDKMMTVRLELEATREVAQSRLKAIDEELAPLEEKRDAQESTAEHNAPRIKELRQEEALLRDQIEELERRAQDALQERRTLESAGEVEKKRVEGIQRDIDALLREKGGLEVEISEGKSPYDTLVKDEQRAHARLRDLQHRAEAESTLDATADQMLEEAGGDLAELKAAIQRLEQRQQQTK